MLLPLKNALRIIACIVFVDPSGGLELISAANEDVRFESQIDAATDDYVDLDPALIIARDGYNSRSYVVQTDDGYLLTLNRIFPNAPGEHHPVLLQHGLVASSADWLILGKGNSLAYLLADEGYDVWLGNIRGNTYSRAHMNLSTDSSEFWSFSFHEMGFYDVPALTAFILKETGHAQLSYVGHSMGTTMFWVFCATHPQLQSRIRQMHALAPVAFMSRMKSPVRNLAPFERELQISLAVLKEYEFLRHGAITGYLEEEFLKINHIGAKSAEYIFFSICGFDPEQFNKSLLPVILGHTPAGASSQTVLHYLQEVKSTKFRQYDEGTVAGNMRRYGFPEPPEYDLSKVNVPVYLHYSLNDFLASTMDVDELREKLKTTVSMMQVPLKNFNHLDFMWANEAKKYVYEPLIAAMKSGSEKAIEKTQQNWLFTTEKPSQAKEIATKNKANHFGLAINFLIDKLNLLHQSAELVQRLTPNLVQEMKKLKTKMSSVEQEMYQMMKAKSNAAPTDLWFKEIKPRVKSVPDPLLVRSVPHVDGVPTTSTEKVTPATAVEEEKIDEKSDMIL